MTAKKVRGKITEKGILEDEIKELMSPEAIKEMEILLKNTTLQQFFFRLFDKHDIILGDGLRKVIVADLKKELIKIYRKDNVLTTRLVVDGVMVELKEYLAPWNRKLEGIEKTISDIAWDVTSINDRFEINETQLKEDEHKIKVLEDMSLIPLSFDTRLAVVERFVKPKYVVFRNIVTAIVATSIAIVVCWWIMTGKHSKLNRIEEMLENHIMIETIK